MEIAVKPDMQLTDLQDYIKIKLGCSTITKMEAFDKDFEEWVLVTAIADLDLSNTGIKLKVETESVSQVSIPLLELIGFSYIAS